MDGYPEHLAPKNAGDLNQESFLAWWKRVRDHYPHVPENVAEQWIWRHWHYSPFGWIPSVQIRFEFRKWPSDRLALVQANSMKGETYDEWGKRLCENKDSNGCTYCWVASYMSENHSWPEPPIILEKPEMVTGDKFDSLPSGYFLIEGHKRFAVASYLLKIGKIEPELDVWVMTRCYAVT